MRVCPKCEGTERYANGACAGCSRARVARFKARNPDSMIGYQRAYAAKNPEKVKAAYERFRSEKPSRVREQQRAWKARNPDAIRADCQKRYAAKTQAVPVWYSEFDDLVMVEAADLCARRERVCGGKWHVDHIVPLRSKSVCGLHVAANIAVIPAFANQSKNNRHWPGMPHPPTTGELLP